MFNCNIYYIMSCVELCLVYNYLADRVQHVKYHGAISHRTQNSEFYST